MIPENFLIFLQIILFMFITPGAPRILIMTQSLNFGFKKYTTKIGLTKDESLYYLKVTNKI